MNRTTAKRIGAIFAMLAPCTSAFVACSSTKSTPPAVDSGTDSPSPVDGATDGGSDGAYSLKIPCNDTIASIYGDAGELPDANGTILRCAPDSVMSAAELYAIAAGPDDASSPPYVGPEFSSGASVYRILYKTERGDTNGTPGYSSALLYVPDHPRAEQSPIVVASHGSRGQAAVCAPSQDNAAAWYVEPDFQHLVYPLVGYGYAVIAPDLAGYANVGAPGNPLSAYGNANDVGRSTLDGARALATALAGHVSSNIVITGHSQGGGTALSALAIAPTYAPDLTIAAVAVYAPLWFSLRSFASIINPNLAGVGISFPFPGLDGGTSSGPVSIWYHYTAGELLDGPGHGLDVFSDAGKSAVLAFVENDCWSPSYAALLDAGTDPTAVFDPNFMAAVGGPSLPWNFSYDGVSLPLGQQSSCNLNGGPMDDSAFPACACQGITDPTQNATCLKWIGRYLADRPHLTGKSAQVPLLIAQGGQDKTVIPSLSACVLDRLTQDQANFSYCFDPAASHSGVVASQAAYVNQWIAHQVLGEGAPDASCPGNVSDLVDDAGDPLLCNTELGTQ